MTENPRNEKLLKIAAIALGVALVAAGYFIFAGSDANFDCKTGCEKPSGN